MKFVAIWQVDGKELLVFPRAKRSHTFPTVEKAERALERKARYFPRDSRGCVKRSDTGEIVRSVQL
ncbi:MAG TPA: hypothetical protein VNL14_13980 [Candidatus Acidoferrales bacterium]|nr:hypothetical protein [Candidatus Acidoferrales bacterium]